MPWMNAVDIEIAAETCKEHPVLGPATRFLKALMEAVDDQSDGWPYWTAPSHSARELQELIQNNTGGWGNPRSGIQITLKDVEKTLIPIRRMVTVQSVRQKRYGSTFKFDVDRTWERAKGILQQLYLIK